MEIAERCALIGRIPLFRDLPEQVLSSLAGRLVVEEHPRGALLLREGGTRVGLYLLLSGRVSVVKDYGLRIQRELNTLGPGCYLGEMSLLDHAAPSASVIAAEPVSCLFLTGEDLEEVLSSHPVLARELLATLSRRVRKLEEGDTSSFVATQAAIMLGMAKLAEFRDPETGAHLERTRHYCRILAEAARGRPGFGEVVDDEFVEMIFLSSPLHDIGKVGVPDAILHRPTRLTPDEYKAIKVHPELGARAISEAMKGIEGVTFLSMGRDIALGHHECWDGSGYPRGLKGERIPLCARIMAVADVYDALRSTRVYRPGLPHEKVREMLIAGTGTQFDPRILGLFREREFIEVHERFQAG